MCKLLHQGMLSDWQPTPSVEQFASSLEPEGPDWAKITLWVSCSASCVTHCCPFPATNLGLMGKGDKKVKIRIPSCGVVFQPLLQLLCLVQTKEFINRLSHFSPGISSLFTIWSPIHILVSPNILVSIVVNLALHHQ